MNWLISIHAMISTAAVVLMFGSFLIGLLYIFQSIQLKAKKMTPVFWKLPALATSAGGTWQWLKTGFIALTFTLASGGALAVWGNTYDPDVIWVHALLALVAWGLYASLLWDHRGKNWTGSRVILLSLIGFAAILLVYWLGPMGAKSV